MKTLGTQHSFGKLNLSYVGSEQDSSSNSPRSDKSELSTFDLFQCAINPVVVAPHNSLPQIDDVYSEVLLPWFRGSASLDNLNLTDN